MEKLVYDEKDLYEMIPKEYRDDYAIGIHGFDNNYWKINETGEYELDLEKIEEVKALILEHGLKFPSERSLLSTVRFQDITNSYITTKGSYSAGGIIVALPKIIKTESGRKVFIGSPNENLLPEMDRNRKETSLCEIALAENGVLDSMFILGKYKKNAEETGIIVTKNPKHISKNDGFVKDEYFDNIKNRLLSSDIPTNVIAEAKRQQREYYNRYNECPER